MRDRPLEFTLEGPVKVHLLREGASPQIALVEELEANAVSTRHRADGDYWHWSVFRRNDCLALVIHNPFGFLFRHLVTVFSFPF